jgi:hypothetical protein
MSVQTITISTVELSSTDLSVLKVATGLVNSRADLNAKTLDKTDTTGNIVLVDMDTEAGKQFYQQFQYGRQRVMLLLSTETLNEQRSPTLKKPVRVQTLKDVLVDLYEEMFIKVNFNSNVKEAGAKAEGTSDSTKPASSSMQTAKKPTEMLFFILLNLKESQHAAQIFCPPFSPLFVDAKQNLIASSASRETLRKMTHGESGPVRSTQLSTADFNILARGQLIIPLASVLWSAGVYGSNGILLPGHSLDTPVQMNAWPNLSRLEFNTEHMKLASLMTSQALSLRQIQEKSNLPLETIIGFYNASYANGLIVIKPEHLPTPALQAKAPVKRNLLNKIAQRLKLSSNLS